MTLRGKQKRFLRSQAHHLNPIFQIGKDGMSEALVIQVGEALEKRELIKISLLQNTEEEVKEVAEEMAKQVPCEVAQVIGRVIVLYKASSKEKYQKFSPEVAKLK